MSDAVVLLIGGLGSALTALGFYLTSRRNAASSYTSELERRMQDLRQQLKDEREAHRMTQHDLQAAERRIDTLIDKLHNGK